MVDLRSVFSGLCYYSGAAGLARRLLVGRGRIVLNFHGVCGTRQPGIPSEVQPHFSMAELRQVLVWLKERFAFLTPDEFLNSGRSGVLLTFDDGLANNYMYALPVLEEFQAPAIFFITTQHVIEPHNWLPATRRMAQKYWERQEDIPEALKTDFYDGLSIEQLAACACSPWVTIGSHTVSHPFLTHCTPSQIDVELRESRRFLQEVTGQPVDLFAYPTGDYDRRAAEAVVAAGYRAAFAVDPLPVGLPHMEIPRIGLYAPGAAYVGMKLSGLYRPALPAHPIL